jgi:hypothetical protein
MAKDAYYFSHDSNARQDEKIIKLRMKLGWEGYGLYWALIEMLRDANDYSLETDYDSIAFELRTECERIKSIVEDYNLFELDDCFFYSESLNKRMELKHSKSEKARLSARARWDKEKSERNANGMRTHSEGNAIKGKESKEKEIKGNKTKENKSSLKGSHLFSSSPYYDIEKFKSKFENTDYQYADLNFYYEAVKNWADSKGEKKKDWIATARNFMLRDKKDDKLQLANNVNNESNGKPTDEERLEFWKRVHGEI